MKGATLSGNIGAAQLRDRPRTAERQSQNGRLGTHAILAALAPPG